MITQTKIMNAINEKIVQADPESKVYIQFCPQKFARPCHFIEAVKEEIDYNINRFTLGVVADFAITSFLPADENGISDTEELLRVQKMISGIFGVGYIIVDDRAIKITKLSGGDNGSYAYTEVTMNYYEDKVETTTTEEIMGDITINIKEA